MKMHLFLYQLKQAYFSLKQKPGFVFSIVSTMGITLGALLSILTLAYVLFFKGLPYPDYQTLVKVEHELIGADNTLYESAFSYPSLLALYDDKTRFNKSTMAYYSNEILAIHASQPTIATANVTPEYFELFSMKMTLGRAFDQSEGLNSDTPLAVISHETWIEVFDGDKNILNTTIKFWDTHYQIIGVSAADFEEPLLQHKKKIKTQVWLTWDFNNVRKPTRESWGAIDESIFFIGQLTSSKQLTQTQQSLSPFINEKWQAGVSDDEFFKGWSVNIKLTSLINAISGEHKQSMLLLTLGIIGIVLIACANITNLFITRGAERTRVMAIFAVVGAKKRHIFNYSIAESLILMFSSICIALIICQASLYVLVQSIGDYIPHAQQLSLSWFTLAIALTILIALATFFAFVTAYMVNYSSLIGLLRASGKGVAAQLSTRIRQFLVISQVTIAALLVFTNISLFQQSMTTLLEPASINTDNFIDIALTSTRPPTQEEINGPVLGTGVRNEFLLLPQVQSVSNTLSPLSGFDQEPMTDIETNRHIIPETKYVDDLYFQLIGQQILSGDIFSRDDLHEGFTAPEGKVESTVVIVNDKLANFLDPSGSVIGRKLLMDEGETFRIIGVVKGIKMPGAKSIPLRAYLPASVHSVAMTVQLKSNQTLSREEIVSAVKRVTSFFALYTMNNVTEIHQDLLFNQKATAYTTGTLAILTIILSAIGLYGVLNYTIHTQRFEIGTRLAIGAKSKDILGLVLKNNSSALIIGFVMSIVILSLLYLGFNQQLSSYISSNLIGMYLLTLAMITFISFFACYLPLRQYITKPAIHSLRGSD
jgi:predicted permease